MSLQNPMASSPLIGLYSSLYVYLDVVCYQREDWKKEATFTDDDSSGVSSSLSDGIRTQPFLFQPISALCLSSNGSFLAVATESKQIMIYSTSIKKVIYRNTSESIPISISFSPSENLLAWTCLDGSLLRVQDTISKDLGDPNKKVSEKKVPTTTVTRNALDPLNDIQTTMDYDDDWVIDDLGDGYKDEPAREPGERYTKEMGVCPVTCC